MNGMNEQDQGMGSTESTEKTVGFCQHCGKSLTGASVRVVGPAVYCEPCLAARLAGGPMPGPAAGAAPGYSPVNTGAGGVWVAPPPAGPNPGLAALLGLIPGVGAMYNEQYAKGIVHLIVFAVLVTLASDANGIFGLFVAGWEFYMAIEAHHTAKARRDGTPLPNPFGLNDIGERLGFGRAWPGAPDVAGVAHDAAQAASETFATGAYRAASGATPPVGGAPFAGTSAGWDSSAEQHWQTQVPYAQAPVTPGYEQQAYPPQGYGPQGFQPGYGAGYGSGYGPPVLPYGVPFDAAAMAARQNRFPAGAVWLIGLGVFFLLATTGIFHGLRPHLLLGFGLIGVAVWVFVRRMTETGLALTSDGSPLYSVRLLRALGGSIWIAVVGMLFLIDSFGWLGWHRSWPWLIILAGVMMLLQRTVQNAAATAAYERGSRTPVAGAEPSASAPVETNSSVVPANGERLYTQPEHRDENDKGGN